MTTSLSPEIGQNVNRIKLADEGGVFVQVARRAARSEADGLALPPADKYRTSHSVD